MRFYTKYLAFLTGVVAIAAATTACTQDDVVGTTPEGGEETMVSFVLTTDEAEGEETRAISDGTTVDLLYYAIYNENGEVKNDTFKANIMAGDTISTPLGNIVMMPTPYMEKFGKQSVKVSKLPLNEVTESYRRRLQCNITDKMASVINITMTDVVPRMSSTASSRPTTSTPSPTNAPSRTSPSSLSTSGCSRWVASLTSPTTRSPHSSRHTACTAPRMRLR